MLSNNPTAPQTSQPGNAKAVASKAPVPPMEADNTIETAGAGSGTVTDPGGTDRQPPAPVTGDFEFLV